MLLPMVSCQDLPLRRRNPTCVTFVDPVISKQDDCQTRDTPPRGDDPARVLLDVLRYSTVLPDAYQPVNPELTKAYNCRIGVFAQFLSIRFLLPSAPLAAGIAPDDLGAKVDKTGHFLKSLLPMRETKRPCKIGPS